MGAWGIKAFENDTGCDWAYDLEEAKDLSLIESTLDQVLEVGSDYLDASEAEEAVAACETLAKMLGRGDQADAYTESVDQWVKQVGLKPDAALLGKAQSVLDRILGDASELKELWEEGDEFEEWKAYMTGLQKRLAP